MWGWGGLKHGLGLSCMSTLTITTTILLSLMVSMVSRFLISAPTSYINLININWFSVLTTE